MCAICAFGGAREWVGRNCVRVETRNGVCVQKNAHDQNFSVAHQSATAPATTIIVSPCADTQTQANGAKLEESVTGGCAEQSPSEQAPSDNNNNNSATADSNNNNNNNSNNNHNNNIHNDNNNPNNNNNNHG